jgi:amidase
MWWRTGRPDYDSVALARCFLKLYLGQVAATLAEARSAGARSADFELATRLPARWARSISATISIARRRLPFRRSRMRPP